MPHNELRAVELRMRIVPHILRLLIWQKCAARDTLLATPHTPHNSMNSMSAIPFANVANAAANAEPAECDKMEISRKRPRARLYLASARFRCYFDNFSPLPRKKPSSVYLAVFTYVDGYYFD